MPTLPPAQHPPRRITAVLTVSWRMAAVFVATTATALLLVSLTFPASLRTALQVQEEAPAGAYAHWLEKAGRAMPPAGVQPGSVNDVGKHGMSTNAVEGDGAIDTAWKQMWSAIPAGYSAVKKELKGYLVDGKLEHGDTSEKKAGSELSSYASILGDKSAWPKNTPEAKKLGKEGRSYDRELQSYDGILSFPPAHPMHQPLLKTLKTAEEAKKRKKEKVQEQILKAEAELHAVDKKLHAVEGGETDVAGGGKGSQDTRDRCHTCKDKWTAEAMACAQDSCSRKLWSDPLTKMQVQLNNKLASMMQECVPERAAWNTKAVVSSFVLPWNQPFSAPAHSWVRAVANEPAYSGVGLVDGETTELSLGGNKVLSGADLTCKDGRSLSDHVADLNAPQRLLNKQKARAYFDGLSSSREGARHMADKALETQVAGAAVLSWISPGGHRGSFDFHQRLDLTGAGTLAKTRDRDRSDTDTSGREASERETRETGADEASGSASGLGGSSSSASSARKPRNSRGRLGSSRKGGVRHAELALRRQIEALKVARLRKRLLRLQRQEALGGAYPGSSTRGQNFRDGGSGGWGDASEKVAKDSQVAREEEEHKEHVRRREHQERESERKEGGAAVASIKRSVARDLTHAAQDRQDMSEIGASVDAEEALAHALRAKEALLDAIKGKSDEVARMHAEQLTEHHSRVSRVARRQRRHALTDEMRADEIALRNLQDSQAAGVERETQVLRNKAHQAQKLELSELRHKRLQLKHKLLMETIQKLKSKLHATGLPPSLAT